MSRCRYEIRHHRPVTPSVRTSVGSIEALLTDWLLVVVTCRVVVAIGTAPQSGCDVVPDGIQRCAQGAGTPFRGNRNPKGWVNCWN